MLSGTTPRVIDRTLHAAGLAVELVGPPDVEDEPDC
jgi:hypothetical protein